jgi:protein-L-isoaspartate(D-aspartate) O-methyltransferase
MRRLILAAVALVAAWPQDDLYRAQRNRMVDRQIAAREIRDARVLQAMRDTPRHLFVPPESRAQAYEDHPLPIGHGQTISQPYIVAAMTELLDIRPESKVLEIGTGSGYQTAVAARLAAHVYSIEIVPELAKTSAALLAKLGYTNVTVRHGDGYQGWPDHAPFDRIIVTAAPPEIPKALIEQLRPGGKMVVPVGKSPLDQELLVVEKQPDGSIRRRSVFPVRFVPMVPKPPAL